MYSDKMINSMAKVAETRKSRIGADPARFTADEIGRAHV